MRSQNGAPHGPNSGATTVADFTFNTTITRAPETLVTSIVDLDINVSSSGELTLFSLTRPIYLGTAFTLGSDGALSFNDEFSSPAELSQFEIISIGGVDHLLGIGPGLADPILWPIATDGTLGAPLSLPTDAGAFGGFADIAGIAIGGDTFVYGVGYTNTSLYGFLVNPATGGGTGNTPPPLLTNVSRVDTATVGGTPMVLTVSADGRTISSHVAGSGGGLTLADTTGAADGLGVANVGEIRHVSLPDGDYLVVAAQGSSSLSVIAISDVGALAPVDHVVDDLGTRFQNVTALATTTVDGRTLVAAGGVDGGVTVFELLPGGRLHRTDVLLDDQDRALAGLGALAFARTGDLLQLYATSQSEAGISHFTASMANWGPTLSGTGGDDVITGNNLDQILWGRAGNDTLDGGAGADILMDGTGEDELTGGSGADRFVLAGDGRHDTITDFNPLVDVIDLSGWTFLRSPLQLGFTSTANGAEITYRDETLTVISHNAAPLTEAEVFVDGTFNVSRFPVGNPSPGTDITGTAQAEALEGGTEDNVIEGLGGDDTLRGGAGDDVLIGGPGADQIDGGFGEDTVSFASANSAVLADLGFASNNTGEATGDTYTDVEHVEGSGFDDNLRGNAGDNRIKAGAGADTVIAREGDDTLVGDTGDDILLGGLGADWVDGGTGRDRAAYWQATGGLRVDLLVESTNTGEAAGDVYTSIEDLHASEFDDEVLGDNAANQIWGAAGLDTIFGRGGADSLFGGGDDDILLGGTGGDRLDGGAGIDRAAYWTSDVAIRADLQNPQINTGDAEGDTFVSVENLSGTNFNDNLRGDAGNNIIWGSDGRDVIYGRAGDDTLNGQEGGDTFIGGEGADRLVGGVGIDRAAYWNATTGITADLISAGVNTGEAAGDVFISIENLEGGDFDDDLRGQNGPNRLWGGEGNDIIYGRGGDDTFFGEEGNDTLLPGVGLDTIDGGSGTDRVAYWTAKSGLTVNLADTTQNTGEAAGHVYISIEGVQGSNFDDLLIGTSGNNTLIGGGGNDTLNGGLGNDILRGSGGADEFVFNGGDDVVEDYAVGADVLGFDVSASLTEAAILALAQASGGGTLFDFGAGDRLFLEGVDPNSLSLSDITLV